MRCNCDRYRALVRRESGSQVSPWVGSLIGRTTGSIRDATRGNPEQTSAASRHRDQGTVLHPHFGWCFAACTGSRELLAVGNDMAPTLDAGCLMRVAAKYGL
jgi:hypothetical protein